MYPAATFSDAPFTAPAGTTYVGQIGVLTASRTVTLPLASTLTNGTVIIVKDDSGTATAVNTVVVARQGTDTINGGAGSLTIDGSNGAYVRLVSNGTTGYTGSAATGVIGVRGTGILTGNGTPLSVVVAPVGTLYLRLDGGTTTTLYVKETGAGLSTGWVAK